jgi:hypothetical protein
MVDALSGPDGTQPLPPPTLYSDPLSGLVAGGARYSAPARYVRTRPPAPVRPRKPSERARQAVRSRRRERPADEAPSTWSVPAAYGSTDRSSVVPKPVQPAPKNRTGAAALGCLFALLDIGWLAFMALQGILH